MTTTNTDTIAIDQFVDAPPSKVWRTLTEPALHARWWVPGDIAAIVGHRFHLQMPGWGSVPCEVLEVVPEQRLVYTFNETWTLTWRLAAEGRGTRLFFEHSGFDFDRKSDRDAFNRMGPGWRDKVLPQLVQTASQLTD
ncbi:polyketide cyclase [Micromonospora sp. S4605]|uniref:SRPBCC family protein n=1 Tax=Micromonospora sp. S4605 TaxID=1420897 RepID=UPI000D6F27D8|nr:SRPBCC domain-containing protein [Micromonospora sp. S4605]PWU47532.1 polyketide cyclase [Micromonospora sp. S4605]